MPGCAGFCLAGAVSAFSDAARFAMRGMSLGVSLVAVFLPSVGKLSPAPSQAAGLFFARGPMSVAAAAAFLLSTLVPLALIAFVLIGLWGRDPDRED